MSSIYALCLDRRETPFEQFPPVCVKPIDHDGDHRAAMGVGGYPGTGETWPNHT